MNTGITVSDHIMFSTLALAMNLTKLKKFTLGNACISLLEESFSLTKEEGLEMF